MTKVRGVVRTLRRWSSIALAATVTLAGLVLTSGSAVWSAPGGPGYWLVGANGGVWNYGSAGQVASVTDHSCQAPR